MFSVSSKKGFQSEVIDRLARIEERVKAVFDKCESSERHVETMNHEMGGLEKRVGELEVRQTKAEDAFKKANFYWKMAAIVISPILTTVVVGVIHYVFGF